MKAVIVEIKNGNAAVLSDDGCVVTIKNNNYEIGQVIQMNSPKVHLSKKVLAFTASAAAFVVFSVGTWAYASPYSYVSIDVNPSIEYTLNRFDRVLSVKAVNDDGEEIIKEISLDNLKNQTIEDAITSTFQQISDAGYFDGDIEGGIVITTSGQDDDKAEELATELEQTVETQAQETGDDIQVEALNVSLERVEQAHELGVTPGKLNLVEKLQAASTDPSTINLEEWLNKPVKEIMKATKDYRKASAITGSAVTLEEKDKNIDLKQADKEDLNAQKQESKSDDKEAKLTEKANASANKADAKEEKVTTKAAYKAAKIENKTKKTPAEKSDGKVTSNKKAPKVTTPAKVNKKTDQGNNNTGSSNKATKSDQQNNQTSNNSNGSANGGSNSNSGNGSNSDISNHGNSRK